jgi:leucyl aminopeptidase (aminopeptidase T)
MVELELIRPMRVLVEEISGIGLGDEVVILTDDTRYEIAKVLASASRSAGATTALTMLPRETIGGVEPPNMAAKIMKGADFAFILTSNNISHTDAHREAQEAGTEISSMWGANEDLFLNGPSPENYEEIDEIIRTAKSHFEDASEISVESPSGTDITFAIDGRTPIALGIKENDKSSVADFPQGELAIAPIEGSADGTIVIDVAMDTFGLLENNIRLTYEDGNLTNIEGGAEAQDLERLIKDSDESAGNLAEFAIGANREARLVDNLREAKKKYGTIHFAVGDSNTIGGEVKSNLHLDGVVSAPNIAVDGKQVMEAGELID